MTITQITNFSKKFTKLNFSQYQSTRRAGRLATAGSLRAERARDERAPHRVTLTGTPDGCGLR
jgi:hypothetical protein